MLYFLRASLIFIILILLAVIGHSVSFHCCWCGGVDWDCLSQPTESIETVVKHIGEQTVENTSVQVPVKRVGDSVDNKQENSNHSTAGFHCCWCGGVDWDCV